MKNNTNAAPHPTPDSTPRLMRVAAQLFRALPAHRNLTENEAVTLQALCLALYFAVEFDATGGAGWPEHSGAALCQAVWGHLGEYADLAPFLEGDADTDLPNGLPFLHWYLDIRTQPPAPHAA